MTDWLIGMGQKVLFKIFTFASCFKKIITLQAGIGQLVQRNTPALLIVGKVICNSFEKQVSYDVTNSLSKNL